MLFRWVCCFPHAHLEEDDEGVWLRESQEEERQEGRDPAVQDGRPHLDQAARRTLHAGTWNTNMLWKNPIYDFKKIPVCDILQI